MTSTPKSSARSYQIALSLMFGSFLLGMAVTLVMSAERGGRVTDPDYYLNGLRYDQTPSGAKNPGLNWTMSASLEGKDLLVRVSDVNGALICGGSLFFQPKRSGEEQGGALHLAEAAPGVFRAPWPASPQGEMHGTLRFSKGEASASQKVVFFN